MDCSHIRLYLLTKLYLEEENEKAILIVDNLNTESYSAFSIVILIRFHKSLRK